MFRVLVSCFFNRPPFSWLDQRMALRRLAVSLGRKLCGGIGTIAICPKIIPLPAISSHAGHFGAKNRSPDVRHIFISDRLLVTRNERLVMRIQRKIP